MEISRDSSGAGVLKSAAISFANFADGQVFIEIILILNGFIPNMTTAFSLAIFANQSAGCYDRFLALFRPLMIFSPGH